MQTNIDFGKLGEALRAAGIGCRFGIRYPDELIDRMIFTCALDCPGITFGEVIYSANSLEDAFFGACVRREDALARQKQAA